jgi:hypothetical protein
MPRGTAPAATRQSKTEGPGDNWKELVRDPASGKLVPGRMQPDTIQVPKSTWELMYTATGMNGTIKGPTTKTVRNPKAGQIIRDK